MYSRITEYLAIENEVLIYATTWMHLENIMLSETGQTQKDKHGTIPPI